MRELRNVLERAAILCEGGPIDVSHLRLQSGAKSLRNDTTDLSVVERTTIAKVLHDCRGNKTKAARRLGLSRTQLHLRIRKYRLEEAASRVIAKQCRVVGGDVMRRSNRMKRILREQWAHFLPSTLKRGR